jgi:poly(3-hydroxybutyrate) depolymerase
MAIESFSVCAGGDEAGMERMTELFGPGHIDQTIRQAVHWCWMSLPKDRKNVDEVERQIRRLVDRAIRDFREDTEAFGRSA